MNRRWLTAVAMALAASAAAVTSAVSQGTPQFDHQQHQRMFPTCDGCHNTTGDAVTFPPPGLCSACHDGGVAPRIEWTGRAPRASNLNFDHTRVVAAKRAALGMDFQCRNCHVSGTGDAMIVQRANVAACLGCHAPGQEHFEGAPCQTCHVSLSRATDLSVEQVRALPRPSDHAETFIARHGPLAAENPTRCAVCHARDFCSSCHVNAQSVTAIQSLAPDPRVAAIVAARDNPMPSTHQVGDWPLTHGRSALESVTSCAVCHAREYCSSCHVNAQSVPAIQQLAPHPRGPDFGVKREVTYPTPPSHSAAGWLETHGKAAGRDGTACATCHARPSCESCHVTPLPPAVERLPRPRPSGSGGATPQAQLAQGVVLARRSPGTHTPGFVENHQAFAAAATSQCAVCHTPDQCTACHTGSEAMTAPGRQVASYHPASFQQQHSAAAFGRSVECATCHNPEAFCRDCHGARGLAATSGRVTTGFHAGKPTFSLGHGQAARQGLESCASCHAQSDCLLCHSALGGRRINPHGAGFDAGKLRSKNPSLCLVCHLSGILNP